MRRLVCLAETDSTNNWLKNHTDLPAFTSVRAIRQTAGRGRGAHKERFWFSGKPGDNLAFSLLLPYEPAHAGRLPAHVALVCHEALRAWVNTRIKWPNDLLFAGRKLAGILCESYPGAKKLFIVGIGINVLELNFPPDLRESATSLLQITGKVLDTQAVWLRLTRALWREFRHPRTPQQLIQGYNRVAFRYQSRREFPGEILEFETLLEDGRAVFIRHGARLLLDAAE